MRKKMSKAKEENKYKKATIKRLAWYFNSYWKLMCTAKNNGRKKWTNLLPVNIS